MGAHRTDVRDESLRVARALVDLAASAYGPRGGTRLVVGDDVVLLASGASVLREARVAHPAARPYQRLVADVQRHVGDGATAALLLASRLVQEVLEDGHVAAGLDGLALARRQAAAVLAARTRDVPPARALAHVAPDLDTDLLMDGLAGLGDHVRLDDIDVRVGRRSGWAEGLVVALAATPQGPRAPGLLLVRRLLPRRPEGAGFVLRDPAALDAARADETAERRRLVTRLAELDVGLVACRDDVPEELAEALASKGIAVVKDIDKAQAQRLAVLTGAHAAHDPNQATPQDVGRHRLERRHPREGGWLVRGDGPVATFEVPAHLDVLGALRRDEAERLLRAAGAVLAEPGAVPGGGRWQREVAASLRQAADVAPGRSPLGLHAAARAFDALADDLVRNAGHDPLDVRLLDEVLDPAACVRHAVEAAFEAARLVLRVDGRHDKRPSDPLALRGSSRPAGSPKGMPGDIPPLM